MVQKKADLGELVCFFFLRNASELPRIGVLLKMSKRENIWYKNRLQQGITMSYSMYCI